MAVPIDPSSKEPALPRLEIPIAAKLALTLPEVCALTGLRMYQVRAAIAGGDLAFIQQGDRGRYVIRRESLEKFLREQERRS